MLRGYIYTSEILHVIKQSQKKSWNEWIKYSHAIMWIKSWNEWIKMDFKTLKKFAQKMKETEDQLENAT